MAKSELFPNSNPDFSAFRPNSVSVNWHILAEGEKGREFEAENGLRYTFSIPELIIIGSGDEGVGRERVEEYIQDDQRSVVERALDLRRPVEEILSGPMLTYPDKRSVVFLVNSLRHTDVAPNRVWGVDVFVDSTLSPEA